MKSRYLHIIFSEDIQAYDIPKFRAAVIEKSNRQSDLFHNHQDKDTVLYRYPLIQYKVTNRKASLICLNEATEDIHYLLKQRNFEFRIGREFVEYAIDDVRLKYEIIEVTNKFYNYNILNWLGLNQDNFKIYQQIDSYVDKVRFLEELLEKHILIFMEAMGCQYPEDVRVTIKDIKGEKYIEYKNVFHLTFTLNFRCNLNILNYIGLGKGVSVGFGIIKKLGDTAFSANARNR